MENKSNQNVNITNKEANVLVLPYPLQGHINPILQFAKRLAFNGLNVTVLVPSSISAQGASFKKNHNNPTYNLDFATLYDGYNQKPDKTDLDAYLSRLKTSTTQSLRDMLSRQCCPRPKMIVYDSLMPWVLDVVNECGLLGAPFFTQSCVVNWVYYHVREGKLRVPVTGFDLVSLPGVETLFRVEDLPSFVTGHGQLYPVSVRNLAFDQFLNVGDACCLFVNTLDNLEIEVINWMESICPVKTIGPCIPSKYLDNRIPNDNDYGLSLFEPQTNVCIQWLDARDNGSVVYVSMGSMASPEPDQMEEIARALQKSNKYFLWVVRTSEENKLPSNFREDTSEKGLIVNWCPQLEVLAHRAIGCFVTHCGWNSTLEAISLGVPMVAFPQWSDQFTNAKWIKDFWRVGDRVKANVDCFATRDDIELCISHVMEGEFAKEVRSNASKLKQLAKATMLEGGTSNRNVEEFVTKLQCVN
ncbi:hypothetical protein vseg_012074 [Gypsophila vaccaria]